jgi:hypothetical protein
MSISGDNKSIKLPAQHYVGFNKRGDDEIPLGFMTVEGDDKAAQKRKATVNSWAAQSTNRIPAQVFDNKPLSGFKMGKSIRHNYSSWGQGNVKWRIEDPRGFELEITSPNFASIVSCTTIENGEILEKCIWGRLGADNVLLPVSSDAYKAATANTDRVNKKVSLRDVKPGDHVVMQNGISGRFLGNLFLIKRETYRKHTLSIDDKKRFIIETKENGKTSFVAISSPKISEITTGELITPEDAEKLINDACKGGVSISNSGYGYSHYIGVSTSPATEVSYGLTPFQSLKDAKAAVQDDSYWTRGCIIGEKDDTWGIYSDSSHHNKRDQLTLIYIESLKGDQSVVNITKQQQSHGSGYWHRPYEQHVVHDIQPGDRINWYGHKGTFKTPNGYVGETLF